MKKVIGLLGYWVIGLLAITSPTCYLLSTAYSQERPSSTELVRQAWDAHAQSDVEKTFEITQRCIDLYGEQARKEQASLRQLPRGADIASYQILNDVATCYFIQAESYMRRGKYEQAIEVFTLIIDEYSFAQAWNPFGWYWHIARASQDSIERIRRRLAVDVEEDAPEVICPAERITTIELSDFGSQEFLDYTKYGRFENIGTKDYVYIIEDQAGLSAAVGEGIFPNTTSVRRNPRFKQAMEEGRLEGSHWDFLHSQDLEAAFFKWAVAPEPPGVRLFNTALILERAGLTMHALKCYYAIVVHFPASYGWTYWQTPWYVGQAAIAKINFILRNNPEIGCRLQGAEIRVINGFDNDVSNDIVIASPGKLVRHSEITPRRTRREERRRVKKIIGDGRVRLFQYQDRSWELMVDGAPYVVKGITYSPTPVGQSPHDGTLQSWMLEDSNNSGKIDGPYEAFVDQNRNNQQDEDEPAVGDFQLMKEMGVNTIRVYHHPEEVNKELLRDLYESYGIKVIMGDFLGKYALGSGASWHEGTDYRNPEHQKNMLASVKSMVEEYKDEPFVLFWLLGNENVYGVACNANTDPEGFFKFANVAAGLIKSLDPERPVAICSGDTLFLDVFAEHCPDIDIFGTNTYRGDYGFGYLWQAVKQAADKPVIITEYGAPAYIACRAQEEAERAQAEYHRAAWSDIEYNKSGNPGSGNSLGGIIFEWVDEWWKSGGDADRQEIEPLWAGPFAGGYMYEEWLGITSQGDGSLSPFLRQLRKAYYTYQEMWN